MSKTVKKKFELSDNSINQYGFRVNMSTLILDRFYSNPVMYYNHWERMGNWTDIELIDGKLYAVTDFIPGAEEKEIRKIESRVEKEYLKGASLGIHILEWEYDPEGIPWVTAEVMEASIVDIPNNKNALALYNAEGVRLEGEALQLSVQKLNAEFENFKNNNQNSNTNMSVKLSVGTYTALGLDSTASTDEVDKAVMQLKTDKAALQTELTQLKADAEAKSKEELENFLLLSVKEGRFTANQLDHYRQLGAVSEKLCRETIEMLPKKVQLSGKEQPTQTTTSIDTTNLTAGREDWTYADWRKKDMKGLNAIREEDTELFQQIRKK